MWILDAGMATAVGSNGPTSVAAMRAGLVRFREVPFHDLEGAPLTGAPIDWMAEGLMGVERQAALVSTAIRECLERNPSVELAHTALLVGVSEPDRPGRPQQLEQHLLPAVEAELGYKFHPWHSRVLPQGRAAGLASLRLARDALRERAIGACLIAGVDSYLNVRDLEHFDQVRRLKTESNSDGFIPGEAAAAVLLVERRPASPSLPVEVVGVGLGQEPVTVSQERPNQGTGLAQAIRAALEEAGLNMGDIHFRLADVSGERYGFIEHASALARLVRERREDIPLRLPAESVGEIGAAVGPCLLGMAYHAFKRHHAPGPTALVCSSADGEQRAAAVLRYWER